MAFTALPNTITGHTWIFRYANHLRLTSVRLAGGIESLQVESGLDVFLPTSISDDDFGKTICQLLDATYFISSKDLPRGEHARAAEKVWKKSYDLWEKKALSITGTKNTRELYRGASCCIVTRTNQVIVFFNTRQKKFNAFFSIPSVQPEYREFIVTQPATNQKLGETARAALDAVVRSFPG